MPVTITSRATADRRGECALAGVAAEWRGVLHETGGDCRVSAYAGVVHGDDCRTHHQLHSRRCQR